MDNLSLSPKTCLVNINAPDNVNRMLIHVDKNEISILPLQGELHDVTGPNTQKVNNGIITVAGNFVMTLQAFLRPPLARIIATITKTN